MSDAPGWLARLGQVKVPHFAHTPGSDCPASESESWRHRQAKLTLAERFEDLGYTARIEETHIAVGRRVDVAVSLPDLQRHGPRRRSESRERRRDNPDSWAAVGLTGTTNMSNVTYAYAICSGNGDNVSGITVTVRHAQTAGPTSASAAPQLTTVTCDGGDGDLISGGAGISGGDITSADFTAPGSHGDHLNGSYPSDSKVLGHGGGNGFG